MLCLRKTNDLDLYSTRSNAVVQQPQYLMHVDFATVHTEQRRTRKMLYIRHSRCYFRTMFSALFVRPHGKGKKVSRFSFLSPYRNARSPILITIRDRQIWSLMSRTSLPRHHQSGAPPQAAPPLEADLGSAAAMASPRFALLLDAVLVARARQWSCAAAGARPELRVAPPLEPVEPGIRARKVSEVSPHPNTARSVLLAGSRDKLRRTDIVRHSWQWWSHLPANLC